MRNHYRQHTFDFILVIVIGNYMIGKHQTQNVSEVRNEPGQKPQRQFKDLIFIYIWVSYCIKDRGLFTLKRLILCYNSSHNMFIPIWCFSGLETMFRLRFSICAYSQTFEIQPLNLGKVFFLCELVIFLYYLENNFNF